MITGHEHLTGPPPENERIRMRADPMCDSVNGGRRVTQETVVAGPDGSLANVLVQLQGEFSNEAVPPAPVGVDQIGCVYVPRVVGLQLGQSLQVHNSDPGLHSRSTTTQIASTPRWTAARP
jgi:hypothetical protein